MKKNIIVFCRTGSGVDEAIKHLEDNIKKTRPNEKIIYGWFGRNPKKKTLIKTVSYSNITYNYVDLLKFNLSPLLNISSCSFVLNSNEFEELNKNEKQELSDTLYFMQTNYILEKINNKLKLDDFDLQKYNHHLNLYLDKKYLNEK